MTAAGTRQDKDHRLVVPFKISADLISRGIAYDKVKVRAAFVAEASYKRRATRRHDEGAGRGLGVIQTT